MSASSSENAAKSVSNQEGQVGSHVAASGPQTTRGHQVGQMVGNDAHPESHVEVLPAGSAPASNTFSSNVQSNIADPETLGSAKPKASDTLGGSTSGDVHTGYGHPGSGQTSQELHDGSNATAGLQGVGASAPDGNVTEHKGQRVP